MPTFDKHVSFLNDVWGLNPSTLSTMRAEANKRASEAPVDAQFTIRNLSEYQCAGFTDFAPIVEQLVEMGPSINVLQQLVVYLNHSGHPTITVPRSRRKMHSLHQEHKISRVEKEGGLDSAAACLSDLASPTMVVDGVARPSAGSEVTAAAVAAQDVILGDNDERIRDNSQPDKNRDDAGATKTRLDADDDGDHDENRHGSSEADRPEVPLEICSPLRNPLLAPLDPPSVDGRTLEMAMFVLWAHDVTPSQLALLEFVDPATIAAGVSMTVHNEILLMFGTLRALLESGCEALELLTYVDAAEPSTSGDDSASALPRHNGGGMDYLTRKALLSQICLRFDLGDPLFWQHDTSMFFMMIHSFRMCYALATDVDEQFTFSQGRITLTLDQVLLEVLNCSLQMPECLFGLANQMLAHHTLWINIRGRLANPYDLIAMVPASNSHAEDGRDPRLVSDLIDTRPRGRFHTSCFHWSSEGSNLIQDNKHWRRVFAASLFVLAGGLWASKQANAAFQS
jgi:hypothetical protein